MSAILSAVGIHDASSYPNPFAPRRSGRPTPTRAPFNVAIAAPTKTPKIVKYGFVGGIAATCDGAVLWGGVALASDAVTRFGSFSAMHYRLERSRPTNQAAGDPIPLACARRASLVVGIQVEDVFSYVRFFFGRSRMLNKT